MKVIITMAGNGSRFVKAGYSQPKYEIMVAGRSLFDWSMLSLSNFFNHDFYFIGRSDFGFENYVSSRCEALGIKKYKLISLDKVTSGQAETVYESIKHEEFDDSIFIFNIDTAIKSRALFPERINSKYWWVTSDLEGSQWSFAQMDKECKLIKTSEKVKISSYASIGVYYFHSLFEFRDIFLKHNAEVKKDWNETYIAPFYNFINRNDFDILHISKDFVYGLGTPEEVEINQKRLVDFDKYEDISVVVSQYNGWNYVPHIIDKFLKQSGDFTKKLIIVNNGSNVECPISIKEMIESHGILLINKDYGNIGFGRQVAIDNALGNYVTILDIDDSFDDDYLQKMFNVAISKNSDFVNANKIDFDFENNVIKRKLVLSKNGKLSYFKLYPHNRLIKRDILAGVIVKKSTIFDDASFMPQVIFRARNITECDTNYYWRWGLPNSAARGHSKSKSLMLFKDAIIDTGKFMSNKNVKYAITWELLQLEKFDPGFVKRSKKFKIKFFMPWNAHTTYLNLLVFLYKTKALAFYSHLLKNNRG